MIEKSLVKDLNNSLVKSQNDISEYKKKCIDKEKELWLIKKIFIENIRYVLYLYLNFIYSLQ